MVISQRDAEEIKGKTCNYYLKMRLHEWGIWARGDELTSLGYGRSNIAQIMASGGVFIETSQRSEKGQCNVEAEEVDKWVCELASLRRHEAQAICDFYIMGGGKKFIAQRRKIAIRTLEDRLKYAHVWLEARLFSKTH